MEGAERVGDNELDWHQALGMMEQLLRLEKARKVAGRGPLWEVWMDAKAAIVPKAWPAVAAAGTEHLNVVYVRR